MYSQSTASFPCAIYTCTYSLHKDDGSAKRALKNSKKIGNPQNYLLMLTEKNCHESN